MDFSFDDVTNYASSAFDSATEFVGDSVNSVIEGAKGIFEGDNPLDAMASGGSNYSASKPMLQYPETLGAGANESMYESDPEKDDSWMSHTPDKGDDAIISSESNDPFISFNFKEISTTMDDVAAHKFESTKLIKGVVVSKVVGSGVQALTNSLGFDAGGSNTLAPGDKSALANTANKAAGWASNLAALGYIADAAVTMSNSIDQKPIRSTIARVALYMPPSMQISDSAEYSPNSNKALAYAAEAANALRDKDGKFTVDSVTKPKFNGDMGVGLAAGAGEALMGGGLIGAAASQLGFSDMSLMATMGQTIKLVGDEELRLLGKAINPNDYMQFKSINLRQFSLNFKFLPDSISESIQVEKIIKQFRSSMYPIKHSNITMTVPNMLDIKFHNVAGMVKMPEVALTNVNITYNPNSASFFKKSGQPVEISMDIQLQEIHPIHRADVEEGY